MARLPNFLVIIRSEKLSGKGQGRGAKKRTFRFGKKNVSFPKVETFRFADYNSIFANVPKLHIFAMFGGTIREKSKVLHFVEIASFDHHEAQAIAISVGLLVYVVEVSGDT